MVSLTGLETRSDLQQIVWLKSLIRSIKTYDSDTISITNDATVTSICEGHLKSRLAKHADRMSSLQYSGAATLSSMSTGKIIELLKASDCIEDEIRTLSANLDSTTIRDLLMDLRMPYFILRAFLHYPSDTELEALEDARAEMDIDEVILAKEYHLRSKNSSVQSEGLLRLDDLKLSIDRDASITRSSPGENKHIMIERKEPPKGGLKLLDTYRPKQLQIQSDMVGFISSFKSITNDVLDGLNWDNVLVAGDIILKTLLQVAPPNASDKKVKDRGFEDWGIDIYVYGLGPIEANRKVREIYEVWNRNLPTTNTQRLVVKDTRAIIFLADFPYPRLQVVVKLFTSSLQVLSCINCDECALGYNGKDVFMLPRCVRALETGYSIFRTESVWSDFWRGDSSEITGATLEARGFQYAARGFGLRILPSTIKQIEKDYPLAYTRNPSTTRGGDDIGYSHYHRDPPFYRWDNRFEVANFSVDIDMTNSDSFLWMRTSICNAIGIPFQQTGWSNYLTRRIRTQVYGHDLDAVMEKQITMPIMIPHDLEHTVHQYMDAALSDAGVLDDGSYRVLIPVHVAGQGTTIIPDLPDTVGPPGNVRYWVLANETIWAGVDHRIDAVFEILGALCRYHDFHNNGPMGLPTDVRLTYLARDLQSWLPPSRIDNRTTGDIQRSW
ncbi:MAG: hypothetical protein M1812_000833 [Candelaria pacifica]|nr:MAG: hypothetical protein M1812_000833 [Candelaria pacifica]